jgi:hypothetical protein
MDNNKSSNNSASSTVVAYFAKGDEAQRAIGELREEGFASSAIGAAFHSGASTAGSSFAAPSGSASSADDTLSTIGKVGSSTGVSGASSDTSGVTPAGLSTGGGTVVSGAGRPGPIPGSDIPITLPTNIPSSLRSSNAGVRHAGTDFRETVDAPIVDAPIAEARLEDPDVDRASYAAVASHYEKPNQSWWDKVKHLFSDDSEKDVSRPRPVAADKSAANFGTGEGQLGIAPSESGADYAYSGSAFESSFSGMGVPQPHARRLSNELRRGGAIVTVNAGSEAAKAEQILERNGGTVRYEAADLLNDPTLGEESDSRVEVFGSVQRVYPAHTQRSIPDRKAS